MMLTGAVLEIEILNNPSISENSSMTRDFCVNLASVGDGLQRTVSIDFEFVENTISFGRSSELASLMGRAFLSAVTIIYCS